MNLYFYYVELSLIRLHDPTVRMRWELRGQRILLCHTLSQKESHVENEDKQSCLGKTGKEAWMDPCSMIFPKTLKVALKALLRGAAELGWKIFWLQVSSRILATAYYMPATCQVQFSSVQFSRSVMSDSLRPHRLQHARLPCPSPTPGVYSNSCPLRW